MSADADTAARAAQDAMTAEELRARILADPDLVLEDRDLVRALISANQPKGRKVVDLRGALVNRLESRLDRLETTHRSVIAAAYENLAGASQIHRSVLALLDQTGFAGFLRTLAIEVPEIVAVDVVRLCIETDEQEPGVVTGLGADLDGAMIALPPGGVDAYMALGAFAGETDPASAARRAALRQTAPEADMVYGEDAIWIRSEALVKLDIGRGGDTGLLLFAAEDPHRFSPDHGVDLLAFFGGAVERCLRRWLADPDR